MQVQHNGESRELTADGFGCLGEAIDAWTQGENDIEVVVRLVVDGRDVPREEWDGVRERPCRQVGALEIETRPLEAIARASLAHLADYCTPVLAAIEDVVARFRSGQLREAHARYADLLDALTVCTETLAAAAGPLAEGHPFLKRAAAELHPWLEALFEAQHSDDRLLLADYLEYEVTPIVRGWSTQLRAVAPASGKEDRDDEQ